MLSPSEVVERAFPLRHPHERAHFAKVEKFFGQYLRHHHLEGDHPPPARWFWVVAQERT